MRVVLLDDFHPVISDSLANWNWDILDGKNWSVEDFKKNASTLDGLIIRSSFSLDKKVLKLAKNLKFIGRPGSGLENIDLKYCKENNIEVFRSPEGNCDALAEHALGMLLALVNNIPKVNLEVRNGLWRREENRGFELMGKTMGIIGYGYMGKAFAQRLAGFGIRIIAYDKYISGFGNSIVEEVELNKIFEEADFVSLHTPLSEETTGLVDEKFIEKFKNPFFLINTARGKSVVLKDLVAALKSKKILGACLDVLEIETRDFRIEKTDNNFFYELTTFENVILSPHIAGWTYESKKKMGEVIINKIKQKFILKS